MTTAPNEIFAAYAIEPWTIASSAVLVAWGALTAWRLLS